VTVQADGRRQRTEVRGDGSYTSHNDVRARVIAAPAPAR
jgi:hypothetical protein